MWWLPNNPTEKIYGTLEFKHDYIELKISGVFSKKISFQSLTSEILHGLTNENKKITLYNVSELYYEGPYILESGLKNNFGESIFSCEYVFVGRHFDHAEDILFNFLYINYTYLNEWINNKLEYKRDGGDYNIKTKSFTYNLNLESISSSLQISSDARDFGNKKTDIIIRYVSHMLITPSEAKNWKWFKEFIDNLKNLLTLLIGFPVYPVYLLAHPINGNEFEAVDIYYHIPKPMIIEDIHPRAINIPFCDIIKYANRNNQTVTDIVNNWFKEAKIIEPVFDLFFLTFYDYSMSAQTLFMTLMRAIESFHRLTRPNERYIDGDKCYETLISAIPQELDPGFKKSLEGRLKYCNEYSLNKRLKILQKGDCKELKWFDVIMRDEKGIINKLVTTRNYYTHFDNLNKEDIISDTDLPRINNKLTLFLRILLLEQIDPKGVLPVWNIVDPFIKAQKIEKEELRFIQNLSNPE